MRRDLALIVLLGATVVSLLAWTSSSFGNTGLDGFKCAPADVDPAFTGYACYKLFNKGPFPDTQTVLGELYIKLMKNAPP